MFLSSSTLFSKKIEVDNTTKFIFIADMFAEDYIGGAELTLEALIAQTPAKFAKIKANLIDKEFIATHKDKFWIFGNFSTMNLSLIPDIIHNCNYAVIECDYKFCKFRSIEKHIETEDKCDCHNTQLGAVIAAFYNAAAQLYWMSHEQKSVYEKLFSFLIDKKDSSIVLSSVFSVETLEKIKFLRNSIKEKSNKWIVLGSTSWVKGFEQAKKYCEDNKLDYEVVWNIPYEQMLEKLADAKGLVYLPLGADTCPRLVIEAKLLGCELVLNDFVQHHRENWFNL